MRQHILQQLMDQVVMPILVMVATTAGVMLLGLLRQYARRLGLQLEAQEEGKLREIAQGAVLLAEERIERDEQAGTLPDGPTLDMTKGDHKAILARDVLRAKLPSLSQDAADRAVDQAVAALPGLGASGKAARRRLEAL